MTDQREAAARGHGESAGAGGSGLQQRIIIDTDIGGDPDDAAAIALAVASPELRIEGITTVYADVGYHARRAAKLLRLAGAPAIPIYNGLSRSLLGNRDISWAMPAEKPEERRASGAVEGTAAGEGSGEGSGEAAASGGSGGDGDLLDGGETPADAGRAVDFIIRTVMDNPGEITIVAIGPLTNIAAAVIVEPGVARSVKEIVLMGGVTRLGANGPELPPVEHNIKCDPEAASVVFSCGAPIVMVGLDVTRRTAVGREHCRQLTATGKPSNAALADVIGRWLRRIGAETTPMHDPLAVAAVVDRSLVATRRMKVEVAYDHREGTGTTVATDDPQGTVDVCMDVDAGRFLTLLFGRLCG